MKEYRNLIWNNRRWEGFEFRPDDIIICTPAKCGTTWTQMLCAMLIFGGDEFPDTMDMMSPWLDMNTRGRDEVFDLLDAQTHRRFIKTHTPLDGLPDAPGVTHLIVGRDPRDVAVSMEHHLNNVDFDSLIATRGGAVGNEDLGDFPPPPPPPEDPVERMRIFVESEEPITNLHSVVKHLHAGWKHRHAPDIALFHYRDYQTDLPGELLRLAEVLNVPLDRETAGKLADRAELSRMRARAEELAPDTGRSHWRDTTRFFRTGGNGEWQDRFDEALEARYTERVSLLAEDDEAFIDWLHRGRLASGTLP